VIRTARGEFTAADLPELFKLSYPYPLRMNLHLLWRRYSEREVRCGFLSEASERQGFDHSAFDSIISIDI